MAADVALVRVRSLEPLDLPFQPLNMALDLKKSYALLEFMSHSKAIRPHLMHNEPAGG